MAPLPGSAGIDEQKIKAHASEDSESFNRRLAAQLAESGILSETKEQREAGDFEDMAKIRRKRYIKKMTVNERARRRMRFVNRFDRRREAGKKSEREKKLLGMVSRESISEADLRADTEAIAKHAEIFSTNRAFREKQYAERAEADRIDALEREGVLYESQLRIYSEDIKEVSSTYGMYGVAAEAARQADVEKCCRDIFAQIVDLALVVCEQREMVDAGSQKLKDLAMQDDMMRELSLALAEGPRDAASEVKDFVTSGMPLSNVEASPGSDSALFKTLNVSVLLQHQEAKQRTSKVASDILEMVSELAKSAPPPAVAGVEVEAATDGDGTGADTEVKKEGEVEGEVEGEGQKEGEEQSEVQEGEEKQSEEEVAAAAPPRFPIQVCVVGKPFSGTTTQSHRLAEKYNVKYISATQLVTDNVKTFAGAEASAGLRNGASVSDEIVVSLVVDAVRALEAEAVVVQERADKVRALERRTSITNAPAAEKGSGGKPARLTRLRGLFTAWDKDDSGQVDIGEMKLAVRSFREGLSKEDVDEHANLVLNAMDVDADGKVSWDEMLIFFDDVLKQSDDKLFDETVGQMILATAPEPIQGWVLDGFPASEAQARLLENALNGYGGDWRDAKSPTVGDITKMVS